MPSSYLAQNEYITYGVQTTTPQGAVTQASALVDAYLQRREGLQYNIDANGLPAYMAALSPSLSLNIAGGIPTGSSVVVPVTAGLNLGSMVGDVVILDRLIQASCEAAVITAATKTSITLATVAQTHTANTTVEFGLTVSEQISLPSRRSIARVAAWPPVRLISGLGSYRYGRRIDQSAGQYYDQSILQIMQTFGGPPPWIPFDVSTADVNIVTCEVFIPTGVYLVSYSDVRLYYVAGFSQNNIPSVVKAATAAIINAKLNTDGLQGGLKIARAGDTMLQRFENTVLDEDTRQQLSIYKARMYS